MKALTALIIALALLAGAIYLNKHLTSDSDGQPTATTATTTSANTTVDNTPLSTATTDTTSADTTHTDSTAGTSAAHQQRGQSSTADNDSLVEGDNNENPDDEELEVSASDQDSIDVLELGKRSLDESSFRYWVSRLRDNPQLLQAAVNEFLENTDPTRARNLAALLGEVNTPLVLNAATQLSQSTDTNSQLNGLELLARLQPTNTHARNHAIDMLATQTDANILVATLNVFATPAQAVSPEQRQLLLDHAQLLSTHNNANVRALSIDTMSKWSRGKSDLAASNGLQDADGAVRAKSAASLVGVENASAESRQRLLNVAANKQELKTTRQLALYALSTMPLTPEERQRYEALEIEVRRTRQ